MLTWLRIEISKELETAQAYVRELGTEHETPEINRPYLL
jgi:hypothetical protein